MAAHNAFARTNFFCLTFRMKALISTLVRAFEFSMAISDVKFEKRSDIVTHTYTKDDKDAPHY